MAKILFCGDPHGGFEQIVAAVQAHRPAGIVLLGDMTADRPLHVELAEILTLTQIWWIHGNHDTDRDDWYDNLFGSELGDRNLHGRVVDVAGVRIAGLGGVFGERVWYPPGPILVARPEERLRTCGKGNIWRGGLPRNARRIIFPETYFQLAGQRADVLVTHEAVSPHPHGFAAIDELARSLRVKRALHGHHHDRLDYSGHFERLGFEAFGVGLRGITDIEGNVIRDGELDAARSSIRQQVMESR